jgi:hypothetical protein
MKSKPGMRILKVSRFDNCQNLLTCGLNLSGANNKTIERLFDIEVIWKEPKIKKNFKELYTDAISKAFFVLFSSKLSFLNPLSVIFSHLTFSKITVADNLPSRIWQYQVVCNFIDSYSDKFPLVIIIEDNELYDIINKSYSHIINGKRGLSFNNFYKFFYFFYGIAAIFNGFFKVLIKNLYLRICGIGKVSLSDNITLYQTIVPSNIFKRRNPYDDYYFGQYWKSQSHSKAFLLSKDLDCSIKKIKLMEELTNRKYISIAANLSSFDIFNSLIQSLKVILNPLKIKEYDEVDSIINLNLKEESRTSMIFYNLCDFASIKQILLPVIENQFSIKMFMPFEGKIIEKMIFLNKLDKMRLYGYMHFPLSERHISMEYSSIEKVIIPKSFKMLTIGRNNYQILKNNGWSKNIISIVGSLKKSSIADNDSLKLNNDNKLKLLVVLAMDDEPNNNLLSIAKDVLLQNQLKFQIIIRPHPSLPIARLKELISSYPLCIFDVKSSLDTHLSWTDILVYGESSVSVDSLDYNLARIYIKDCNYLDSNRIALSEGNFSSVINSDELQNLLESVTSNLEAFSSKSDTYNYYDELNLSEIQ